MTEWIYGRRTVMEHLQSSPDTCRKLLLADSARLPDELVGLAASLGLHCETVERHQLDGLIRGGNHQGVCLQVGGWCYAELQQLLEPRPAGFFLLIALDCVQDPRNLGAVLRVADGVGARGVLIPKDRSAGLSAAVARTAAGALASVPVCRVVNLARALDDCRDAGVSIVGTSGEASVDLYRSPALAPCVLVMGGEQKGLRPNVRKRCDHLVSIPMAGHLSSLNLAVACGVASYELRRRHGLADR